VRVTRGDGLAVNAAGSGNGRLWFDTERGQSYDIVATGAGEPAAIK